MLNEAAGSIQGHSSETIRNVTEVRYLPDAQTMISIGLAINEARCDLIARSVREDGVPASYHSYQLFTLTLAATRADVRSINPASKAFGIRSAKTR